MSAEAIAELSRVISWQSASLYETSRGRMKPVLRGIPGELFWHHWKKNSAFRHSLRSAGITVKRIAKGQWEAILWPRKENAQLVELIGFALPVVPTNENPF